MKDGVVFLFVVGSTGAITTMEYEPGLVNDLPAALERVAPKNASYEHESRWHDGNGHSHVRASVIGPCLFVPFQNKKLTLGTWQQIIFVELDVRSKRQNRYRTDDRGLEPLAHTPLFLLEQLSLLADKI